MWRSDVIAHRSLPRDGDLVNVRGYVGVYEAGGQYQLYCCLIRPAGVGHLAARFEELKTLLHSEGVFDPDRKRSVPELPRTIGIVTSPDAAALQDVLTILKRRYPLASVILSPTPVQGEQAPSQIVAAISALEKALSVDVILLVRGGGSLEDLWCFNDEAVVRAVATCRVPVISGVGHETDFTLTDFAADLRAPTPSAAAELATPITIDDLRSKLHFVGEQVLVAMDSSLRYRRQLLTNMAASLRYLSPRSRIDGDRQRLDSLFDRSLRAIESGLKLRRERLSGMRHTLDVINPASILERGYAIIRDEDGQVLRCSENAVLGSRVDIQLHRGNLKAVVEQIDSAT
jgi:exodeoxyribonuclease VII large subunit